MKSTLCSFDSSLDFAEEKINNPADGGIETIQNETQEVKKSNKEKEEDVEEKMCISEPWDNCASLRYV